MAVNSGVVTVTLLCYALLTGLVMSADASVIKRREIAATLQRNGTADMQSSDNRTVTTLTLHAPQVDSVTRSTKLMPQRSSINKETTSKEEENSSSTLKLVPDSPHAAVVTERLKLSLSDLPSTTSAMPNTIDTEQGLKEKHKANEKWDIKATDMVQLITVIPTTEEVKHTTSSNEVEKATTETLLEHKAQLSLDDSNDIQISSSLKQPKFLNDNSTNTNQLNLPNTVDVWTLASMKTVSPRTNHSHTDEQLMPAYSEISSNKTRLLDPVREKTLTDWTQIVQMGVEKSVGNALTEEQQNPDDGEATTTPHEKTTTPVSQTLDEVKEKATTIKSNTSNATVNEEAIILLNQTTLTTLTPATSVNSKQNQALSAFDNVEPMEALKTNDTQYLAGELNELGMQNEEKIAGSKEHESKSSMTNSSQTAQESATTTTTTTTTTEATMKMTTISTPATASVSTTESAPEKRRMQIDGAATGIPESEKGNEDSKNAAVIAELQPTTTAASGVQVVTTSIPIETTTSTTILATHVEEVINLPSTTRQPSPDIHQIGIKSNLETPTTTTATTTVEEVTIETTPTTTTTPTPKSSQRVNSSAITNQTLTQAKDDDKDVDDVTIATTDSLSVQSTSSVELLFSTIATPTTTTEITATTASTIEAAVTKDTPLAAPQSTTSTTTTTESTLEHKEQQKELVSNETTTEGLEQPIGTSTTSLPETQTKQEESTTVAAVSTTTTTAAPARNNTEMSNATANAVRESTSTEAPLTNFIDDSTTTTTAAPNSTISQITSSTSPRPSTSTSTSTPVLSVQTTHTDELPSINTETTPVITEETPTTTSSAVETTTPTVTNTSTETTSELPAFIPPQTSTTTPPTTTTEKTVEMLPVSTQPTHVAAAPTTPIPTTMNPLSFPDSMDVLHAQPPKSTPDSPETDVNVVIAISVSVIGVVALILLVAFLYLMRKRQKATSYGQRCRPVSLDAYSLDNVSVLGSVRRKGALRASKRSYGNAAFDDPSLRHNLIQTAADLAKFVERRSSIFEEFRDVPQIIARPEEIPVGCENKNRYANVIPLPETRVILQRRNDDDTTEYVNANYVRGPKDAPNYYIACQAPLDSTVQDFWRMIWEQQSRVIIQATDLIENGVEKCAEYLPPSVTLDNHTTFGDFQVTLKHREVKDKYAISTIMLKDTVSNTSREITHYWYKWPEIGVPSEEAPIIAMLLEARSSLKSYALEVTNELKEKSNTSLSTEHESGSAKEPLTTVNGAGPSSREINGNVSEKTKNITRNQGPLTIHCSPGTGRTGTIISCDIAIRCLETTKSVDIPQIVYYIRRGRASAVQTKEQYEFIYKVANVYAMKITNVPNDN